MGHRAALKSGATPVKCFPKPCHESLGSLIRGLSLQPLRTSPPPDEPHLNAGGFITRIRLREESHAIDRGLC